MSDNNSNLDLTQVSNEDLEELAEKIEDFYRADNTVKSTLSYHWERNHLFLDGKHWITYDKQASTGGQWSTIKTNKANEYIPRPVTNYTWDTYQTLKSYLIQNKPRSTVIPNSQSYRDKMSAKLGSLVCESNWERLKEEKNYEYASACGVAYGTVFKKAYWDTSTLQVAKVPRVEEQPIIDPSTGAMLGYEEKPVVDPETGEPFYDELPLGDVNTCVVEPHRLAIDPLATDLHNARWVLEYAIQPLDWIMETYSREEEGYTGRAETVKPEPTLSSSMQRFFNLRNSSGTKNPAGTNGGAGGSSETIENSAVVKEYYERPSSQYPKGRLVVVANGVALYAGASPYEGPELGDWHPYSEFRWEIVPGRFWGKSPLDDTTELNKHINSIDATVILVRKTQAIPQKLVPKGAGIAQGYWTGRPGLEVPYRESGPAPSTIPAAGVDAQVWQEREQKSADIKQISGAIDILKGDRPAGVTAASALEMLFEVGTGKLRPTLDRWKVFVESDQKKQLRLIATRYREKRPEFVRMLHMKNKDIPSEAIENFIGEDLHDNCNVRIEAGSNIPKLQSAEKALLLQLAQIGTLNLQDPKNQMEFNRRMGIVGFDSDVSPDVKRAEWENDRLESGLPVVMMAQDKNEIHQKIMENRMKEPSYLELPEEAQAAYQAHWLEHEKAKQQKLMMQQQEALVTGQPLAPEEGQQEQDLQSAGPGLSQKLQKSVIGSDIPGTGE